MDEVCVPLLRKPRAGSQSARAMEANPWEKEQGKTVDSLC